LYQALFRLFLSTEDPPLTALAPVDSRDSDRLKAEFSLTMDGVPFSVSLFFPLVFLISPDEFDADS
jgi:hypothetical protein